MTEQLPAGWAWACLGDIAETRLGKMLSAKAKTGTGPMPYLRNKNVQWGRIEVSDIARMDFDEAEVDRFTVLSGDVLICEGGEVGRTAVWKGQLPWVGYQKALHRVRPAPGVSPEYLAYLMRWFASVQAFEPYVTGSTIKHLPQEDLRLLPVPVPPHREQLWIVAAIEEQFSRLDVAEGLLRRAQSRLGSLRARLLADSLDGWPEQRLGDISRVYVGTTPSRRRSELWRGDVPWVSSGEVAFCRIRDTREKIAAAAVTSPERLHPPGTVLLGMIGEGKTRGQAAILEVAATHNQNSAAVRLDQSACLPGWLFYVLMAHYEETRRAGSGAQQPALNKARVEALRIPLPPVDAQRRAIAKIDQQLSLIDAISAALDSTLRRGAALRRSILECAFAGRLVLQDPADEPALEEHRNEKSR